MQNVVTQATATLDNLEQVAEVASIVAAAPPSVVTLRDGREVHIYKCTPRNIGTVLHFIVHLMEQSNISKPSDAPQALGDPKVLLNLIANSATPLFEVCSELCSEDFNSLLDLELDEALVVATHVIEVNKQFFMQSVLPLVRSVLPDVMAIQRQEAPQPA